MCCEKWGVSGRLRQDLPSGLPPFMPCTTCIQPRDNEAREQGSILLWSAVLLQQTQEKGLQDLFRVEAAVDLPSDRRGIFLC